MQNKKTFADRAIGYDGDAPTAWYTLLFLTFFVAFIIGFIQAAAAEAHQDVEPLTIIPIASAAEIEAARIEEARQAFLAELRICESANQKHPAGDDHAVGDAGDSIGSYQVQKTTLEDWLGRKMSYDEYYSIVTDYPTIHPIVYDAYFERGESWRWKICTKKLNAKGIWAS